MTCKLDCDGGDVGTPGTCPVGETCLASEQIELQPGGGALGVLCNPTDIPTTCDAANQYDCTQWVDSSTGMTHYSCARPEGLCGTEASILTSLTRDELGSVAPANRCGLSSQSVLCPALGPGNAQVECTATGFANPITAQGAMVSCQDHTDCLIAGGQLIADAQCANFAQPLGSVCAVFASVCIAFCEDESGTELPCPGGLDCRVPRAPNEGVGFALFQGGGIDCNELGCFNGATCTSSLQCTGDASCVQGLCLATCATDVDCVGDYYCDEPFLNLGRICMRTPKVCMDPG